MEGDLRKYNLQEALNVLTGSAGHKELDGNASTGPGEYSRILVLEDAVLSASALAGDDLSSGSVSKGTEIHGRYSNVIQTSGRCLVYFG